ncbi:MAG: MerR family transcriptional regulator [Cyanobacteria bacterium P01_A01_bin.123]
MTMQSDQKINGMKVGKLAKQAGISIRTLHYYDEIGLLSPSQRTDTEHRLYGPEDIVRLQQIMSLRQLGFSLEEIRDCLEQPEFSLKHVTQLHINRLKEQIERSHQLLNRLEAIASTPDASVTIENLLQTIEAITMIENYYTPDQLETLKQRREQLGEDAIHQVEAEWTQLIAQARTAMENAVDPASEGVQRIAQRWQELIQMFTGGDAGIARSLNTMYQQEGPAKASQGAADAAVFEYMGGAIAILQTKGLG